jgi:hypothetical protein
MIGIPQRILDEHRSPCSFPSPASENRGGEEKKTGKKKLLNHQSRGYFSRAMYSWVITNSSTPISLLSDLG